MDALEEKGLLKRESNPEDGRGRRIELTVAGRRAISQAKRAQIREAKNILHRLPVRDRTQVLSTLGLLITVMEK
jgi:DNA-binding MarR family transcriptional regulator